MHSGGDILGDKGRKALDACVKVKIFGRPERRRYERKIAETRLRSCYAAVMSWQKPGLPYPTEPPSWMSWERHILPANADTVDIIEIHDALDRSDEKRCVEKDPKEGPGSDKLKDLIDKRRADVKRECEEATANPDGRLRYPWLVAQRRVRDCYAGIFKGDLPLLENKSKNCPETYNIAEIRDKVVYFDGMFLNPEYGPGSVELAKLITAHRGDLEKEFQEDKHRQRKYSRYEAERRVRDCIVSTFQQDTDIFPTKEGESSLLKFNQTYDIFDIQNAIEHFDAKRFCDKYPEEDKPNSEVRKRVDKNRADIETEYAKAIKITDLEHGSGFIIQGHFIITNRHVVESVLYDRSKRTQISISNESIGQLPCEVAHYDTGKDLALLYCKDLKLDGQICPLQLSKQSLLPGMQIFSFGYPISHTEETALFVSGHVAGTKRTYSGHTKAVLNCALNSGNSGGPVLCWVRGELKVVGVATQKHFKEILTLDERQTIEKIRETLQTSVIPEVSTFEAEYSKFAFALTIFNTAYDPRQIPLHLLTLKLYDALETHSQFNLSNAVLGDQVVEFIKDCISKYKGDYHDELTKVIEGV